MIRYERLRCRASVLICAALLSFQLGACSSVYSGGASPQDGNSKDVAADENVISDEMLKSLQESEIKRPDTTDATVISLFGDGASITGSGAKEENGVISVTAGGTYVIRGAIKEGRITVNAPKEEVNLVFDNADITCSYGSPLYIYKSSFTMIYLEEGTSNMLADGAKYTFADSLSSSADEEPDACLYSKSDLIIAGSGKLTVNAEYKNGITGKDTLRLDSASIDVTARANGINGKDFCAVKSASVRISAGDDGLRSTNGTDSSLGYIIISDSKLEINAGEDGIQAETSLAVSNAVCTIKTGGRSGISGSSQADTDKSVRVSTAGSSDISAKGIKAGTSVVIDGGVYDLDCLDDAIHSNGDIGISGGSYRISTGDDGIHADKDVKITGGTIDIVKSYEGIEGESIDISGGTIGIVSSDDGLNAAGGADQSGFGGWMRRDDFAGSSDCSINISGGRINIDASGDGIDSNGSLKISGGEIYVSGPTDNGNSALDYDGSAAITGGTFVAACMSGMAQNFGTDSTQGSIMLTFSSISNEKISLADQSGKVLAECTQSKSYNCVIVSTPELKTGSSYTINAGGQETAVTLDSLIYGSGSGMTGPGNTGGRPNGGGIGGQPWGNDTEKRPDSGIGSRPDDNGGMPGRPENGDRNGMLPDGGGNTGGLPAL